MKKTIKIPRILKIKAIKGFELYCVFNNGETRVVDFRKLFKKWKVTKDYPEYKILDENEFKKVTLRNQTLSWKNIKIELKDVEGNKIYHPFELSPDIVYNISLPAEAAEN